MNIIKTWFISIGGAYLLASTFKILTSESSLKKVTDIFISLFILFYTIVPLTSYVKDNRIFLKDNLENSADISYEAIYKNANEKIIIKSIDNICKKENVTIESYKIDSSLDDENILIVKHLEIDIDDNSKIKIIQDNIKSKLGYEVNIY